MNYTEIEHPSHPNHLLILKPVQEPYYCNGCNELGFKPCYQCPYKSCNFHLHQECATALSSAIHPFFKTCNFMFHEEAPATGSTGMRSRFCDGCGKDVRGYIYQGLIENLHPCCLKLPHILKGNCGLELRLTNKVSMKCLKCDSKEISRGVVNGWSYVSTCERYCYHVACVKDLVLDNWREGYFNHQISSEYGMESSSSLALQTMVPGQEMVLVNGESLGRRSKATKFLPMVKVVLKLIISAIFGDPISGFAAAIESLSIMRG